MSKITKVWAREILDSRGLPTIESAVLSDTGQIAVASVPSASFISKYEAQELRDHDERRFGGKGVLKAVTNVNESLGPAVAGLDPSQQFEIDKKLLTVDGSTDKSKMGANAVLSVSFAVLKMGALVRGASLYRWVFELARASGAVAVGELGRLPTPIFNMINGGVEGAGNLDFQEFEIIPASSKPFPEALRASVEVYHKIEEILTRRGAAHSVGDEGGYAPNLFTNTDALEVNVEAITDSNYQIGRDFFLGLNVASNKFFKNGKYSIKDQTSALDASSLISFFESINKKHSLVVLEDPLHEEDWKGWTLVMSRLGQNIIIVGDDLLYGNPERLKKAVDLQACNGIVVKPNQIGTVTETLELVKQARLAGWKTVISHRAGETNDWLIADFAVGVKSDFVKFGAPARGERVAKYNRLLNIDAELALAKLHREKLKVQTK